MAEAKSGELSFPNYRVSDLEKYRPNPKNYIAGEGFLRRGAGTLLIGPTGMGKSVLAEQIGLCVAAGVDILGRIHVRGARRVLVVQSENDVDTMQRDVLSIVRCLDLPKSIVEKNFTMQHVFGVADAEFGTYFEDQVKSLKPELVVVDHYQSYTDGDLNASKTFKTWISPVQEVMTKHGVALLLVCHKPKPRDVSEWDVRELVYQAMGSSVQSNWARTSAEIAPIKTDLRRFKLTFSKNAERTGLRDGQGGISRVLFIEHSEDPHEPWWKACENQTEEIRVNYRKLVEQFFEANPEATLREAADKIHCSVGVVQKYDPRHRRERRGVDRGKKT